MNRKQQLNIFISKFYPFKKVPTAVSLQSKHCLQTSLSILNLFFYNQINLEKKEAKIVNKFYNNMSQKFIARCSLRDHQVSDIQEYITQNFGPVDIRVTRDERCFLYFEDQNVFKKIINKQFQVDGTKLYFYAFQFMFPQPDWEKQEKMKIKYSYKRRPFPNFQLSYDFSKYKKVAPKEVPYVSYTQRMFNYTACRQTNIPTINYITEEQKLREKEKLKQKEQLQKFEKDRREMERRCSLFNQPVPPGCRPPIMKKSSLP